MALFKILQGKSANLPKTYTEGYCYVTTDEHKLYVDLKDTRFSLNSTKSDRTQKIETYVQNGNNTYGEAYLAYIQWISNNTAKLKIDNYYTQVDKAEKLTVSAGSATQPVYFSDGIPVATTYTLGKSVPSNAIFTDTNTWRGIQDNLTSTSTTDSLSAKQGKILNDNLNNHIVNKSNPHSVTKSQIGLGNVDNTSDINKPISTAQQTAINNVNAQFNNYLPLSAGGNKKLSGPLGLTLNVGYGETPPSSGFTGQLFFVEDDDDTGVPNGGTAGQTLIKNSSTNGDASWANITWDKISDRTTLTINTSGTITAKKVYGAVWNDYAEYRICNEGYCAGRVVCENGDDTLSVSTERLQPGASIVSDTFGFAIGETDEAKCPIAVSGRVLAFPYEERSTFIPGEAVCAAPNGTVSRMTREEVREYPERIIGTVSAIPNYEFWGEEKVPVAGRIWIKVK